MAKSVYSRLGTSDILTPDISARRRTVRGGDTIQAIACDENPNAGYTSSYWREIAEDNDITDLEAITVGTVLKIPRPSASDT